MVDGYIANESLFEFMKQMHIYYRLMWDGNHDEEWKEWETTETK